MAITTIYYIDGEEVSILAARTYYRKAYAHAASHGYADMADMENIWKGQLTEEGRELIHNITAIDERGGLEIMVEGD